MTPDTSLQDLRVIVTGGLGVLGLATAAVLSERGAKVVLVDRAPGRAVPGVAGVIGDVDLGDEAAAARAFEQARVTLGGLNGLVNVAGGFTWETVADGALATWDAMYGMNLRSAVVASRAALPHLLAAAPAAIVNVGALAAGKAGAGMGAYAASKAGVARLTEALAEELKDQGVRVNAVLPSILDTPANRASMPKADPARWVPPRSLAGVIAFLLSAQAADVSGASIPVTGRV
ncbi:MAG: SDR family NAD(P)-dependent oxidoreductase [Pseudomonadota bacterium]